MSIQPTNFLYNQEEKHYFKTQAIKDYFKYHPGIIIGEVGSFAVSVGSAVAAISAVSLTGKVALACLSVISGTWCFVSVVLHVCALRLKFMKYGNRDHSQPPNALDVKTNETAQLQLISTDKSHIE